MSDVSAALLTIGEEVAERAMASIRDQTCAIREIVTVRNVSPFHRALNEAARRVAAPFFVQVDADMILDPDCVSQLRSAVRPDTGIAVGELLDPLVGNTVGVKLYRTACFDVAQSPDTVSMDTDFVKSIGRHGWKTTYVGRERGQAHASRTLGEHRPEYTPAYTFHKYVLEGGRLRNRGAQAGLLWRLSRLEASTHPQSRLAVIALVHGFFRAENRDGLVPLEDPSSPAIADFLQSEGRAGLPAAQIASFPAGERLRDVFRRFVAAGQDMAAADAGADARSVLTALAVNRDEWRSTVAKMGFCHGLLAAGDEKAVLAQDEDTLRRFLTIGAPAGATVLRRAYDSARHHAAGLAGRRSWQW